MAYFMDYWILRLRNADCRSVSGNFENNLVTLRCQQREAAYARQMKAGFLCSRLIAALSTKIGNDGKSKNVGSIGR